MPDRYPHFWGGNQICGQSAPPVKGSNGKKLKMLNFKFACISDLAANTMQTAVGVKHEKLEQSEGCRNRKGTLLRLLLDLIKLQS